MFGVRPTTFAEFAGGMRHYSAASNGQPERRWHGAAAYRIAAAILPPSTVVTSAVVFSASA